MPVSKKPDSCTSCDICDDIRKLASPDVGRLMDAAEKGNGVGGVHVLSGDLQVGAAFVIGTTIGIEKRW